MHVEIDLADGSQRYIHGRGQQLRAAWHAAGADRAIQRWCGPWFWFLSLWQDCRIFQNKSVPDIVEKVFKDHGFNGFHAEA